MRIYKHSIEEGGIVMKKVNRRKVFFGVGCLFLATFFIPGGAAQALPDDSVSSRHIVDGQVKTKDLADDSVGGGKNQR